MCAYGVETQLTEMLGGVFCRNDWEARAVVREIFQIPVTSHYPRVSFISTWISSVPRDTPRP